ncbi:hypothetical protein UFOVP96_37 [uncultured Caudovirales phage]|uniref:Uncharacterized protein n=1 Tax=uncultured Caudovirales phage TaxID=2100421 RepID=A0A6J5KZ45_9CAUD|nr:hypothetical protein UFOVP96_37 [uncultured Caudovirales phage]
MSCEFCSENRGRFNFSNECCWVRWLRSAFKPHAKSMLERYQTKHGRSAMLELIRKVKDDA